MIKADTKRIKNLGDLKSSDYTPRSIKEEIRHNLSVALRYEEKLFRDLIGYDDTVIPDLQRALLSKHNINLLGLRGQAKTRMARSIVALLDEYIPVIPGSELNEDPLAPITEASKEKIRKEGNKMPIEWLHRDERYVEKLATPDVSVADLIGDIDPIKAVNEKLSYNDEGVIHYGLIPRANRCIFCLNEIPDLQPRIQVALFNILQEKDIQIRGFKFRMPLDIQFVFTANPEDYTNRGSIVTPLKDRIGSQILTHYPKDLAVSMAITAQEAKIHPEQEKLVEIPDLLRELIEEVVFEARDNEFVDPKSGVSARLSISAMENLVSAAERRALINAEKKTPARIMDLYSIIPSITGKIEMVYEGEQEGPFNVARILIGKAIRKTFTKYFGDMTDGKEDENPAINRVIHWFEKGNNLPVAFNSSDRKYAEFLNKVEGLGEFVKNSVEDKGNMFHYVWMEFALHGLAEHSKLSKTSSKDSTTFGDLVGSMLKGFEE